MAISHADDLVPRPGTPQALTFKIPKWIGLEVHSFYFFALKYLV
jgi:hypothetical protein